MHTAPALVCGYIVPTSASMKTIHKRPFGTLATGVLVFL